MNWNKLEEKEKGQKTEKYLKQTEHYTYVNKNIT